MDFLKKVALTSFVHDRRDILSARDRVNAADGVTDDRERTSFTDDSAAGELLANSARNKPLPNTGGRKNPQPGVQERRGEERRKKQVYILLDTRTVRARRKSAEQEISVEV